MGLMRSQAVRIRADASRSNCRGAGLPRVSSKSLPQAARGQARRSRAAQTVRARRASPSAARPCEQGEDERTQPRPRCLPLTTSLCGPDDAPLPDGFIAATCGTDGVGRDDWVVQEDGDGPPDATDMALVPLRDRSACPGGLCARFKPSAPPLPLQLRPGRQCSCTCYLCSVDGERRWQGRWQTLQRPADWTVKRCRDGCYEAMPLRSPVGFVRRVTLRFSSRALPLLLAEALAKRKVLVSAPSWGGCAVKEQRRRRRRSSRSA